MERFQRKVTADFPRHFRDAPLNVRMRYKRAHAFQRLAFRLRLVARFRHGLARMNRNSSLARRIRQDTAAFWELLLDCGSLAAAFTESARSRLLRSCSAISPRSEKSQ